MELYKVIEQILQENNRPMVAKKIATIVNESRYDTQLTEETITARDVLTQTQSYPSIFQKINDYIFLVEDIDIKKKRYYCSKLLSLSNTLYFFNEDKSSFFVALLIVHKRLVDKGILFIPQSDYVFGHLFNPIGTDNGLTALHNRYPSLKLMMDSFQDLFSRLEWIDKREVCFLIQQIETRKYDDDEFGSLYEYLIVSEIYKSQMYSFPLCLRELMVSLLNPTGGKTIYDPTAGIGSIFIKSIQAMGKDVSFAKASEMNSYLSLLGNMNLLMHGITETEIKHEHCLAHNNLSETFDYIIAVLPQLNLKSNISHFVEYDDYWGLSMKNVVTFIPLILKKLNYRGKAVFPVPDSLLVKKGDYKELRKFLINNDYIEAIISIPIEVSKQYTDAKTSILVLNKAKSQFLIGKIRLIKALAINEGGKVFSLNTEDVVEAYKNIKDIIATDSQLIDISEIQSDINLSVDAYEPEFVLASTMKKDGSAKSIAELVIIKSGIQPDKADIDRNGDIPLVKIENLAKDIFVLTLSDDIYNNKVRLAERYLTSVVSQDCILVARIGDSLKPTIFRPSETIPQILLHGNVYALIPIDSHILSLEYLYYQLQSSFVLGQILKKRLGIVMPNLSKNSLKQVVIPFMSNLSDQVRNVEFVKAELISQERTRIENKIRAIGYKEEVNHTEVEIMKILTHQLRPKLLNIYAIGYRLQKIIERENLSTYKEYSDIYFDDFINPEIEEFIQRPDNFTLKELLDKLINDSKYLSDTLNNVDNVMNFKFSKSELVLINILDFFQQYREQKKIEINGKYSISVKGDSAEVWINKSVFKELLDQLLINAEVHGFLDATRKGYAVSFQIKYVKLRGIVSIKYSNNGVKYKLSHKDFISAFEKGMQSSGSGIGGYFINKIVEAHQGKMEIDKGSKKGFSLSIELPIKPTL